MVSPCCHRSSKHGRRRISHGTWLVDFPRRNGVIQAFCLVCVDDVVLACSDSPFGKRVFDGINNLYEWKTWESRVCTQCGARITQAYDKHTKFYCEFEISFAESHSSTCHHIDDETSNPNSRHLSCLNFEP